METARGRGRPVRATARPQGKLVAMRRAFDRWALRDTDETWEALGAARAEAERNPWEWWRRNI